MKIRAERAEKRAKGKEHSAGKKTSDQSQLKCLGIVVDKIVVTDALEERNQRDVEKAAKKARNDATVTAKAKTSAGTNRQKAKGKIRKAETDREVAFADPEIPGCNGQAGVGEGR